MMDGLSHRKSPYERFMDEYTAIEVPSQSRRGFKVKYVYYGTWYIWDLPDEQLKKKKVTVLFACGLGLSATIAAACIHHVLNTMLLVGIPATLALLICLLQTINVGRFVLSKNPTSRSNYRAITNGMKIFSVLSSILSAITVLSCLGYSISLSLIDIQVCIIPFLHLIVAASSVLIWKTYTGIPFRTEKNDTLSKVKRLSPNS